MTEFSWKNITDKEDINDYSILKHIDYKVKRPFIELAWTQSSSCSLMKQFKVSSDFT